MTRSIATKNKELEANNIAMSMELKKYLLRIPSLSNKKTVLLPLSTISSFQIEDGIVFAHTADKRKHALTITTLNELESRLNPAGFFRINRSEIVNIDFVESYEPYFKDRLAIKLSIVDQTLYTSNKKSAPFREWLINPTH